MLQNGHRKIYMSSSGSSEHDQDTCANSYNATNNMHYNTYSQEELQHEVLQMPQEDGNDTGWLQDEVGTQPKTTT